MKGRSKTNVEYWVNLLSDPFALASAEDARATLKEIPKQLQIPVFKEIFEKKVHDLVNDEPSWGSEWDFGSLYHNLDLTLTKGLYFYYTEMKSHLGLQEQIDIRLFFENIFERNDPNSISVALEVIDESTWKSISPLLKNRVEEMVIQSIPFVSAGERGRLVLSSLRHIEYFTKKNRFWAQVERTYVAGKDQESFIKWFLWDQLPATHKKILEEIENYTEEDLPF